MQHVIILAHPSGWMQVLLKPKEDACDFGGKPKPKCVAKIRSYLANTD